MLLGEIRTREHRTNKSSMDSQDLEQFEVRVDNQPIPNHPLKVKEGNEKDFFCNYLRSTNRFYNSYSNGCMSFEDFRTSNFLIYANLKDHGFKQGQLTLKLRFKTDLPDKLFLIYMPVYDKRLTFDSYMNPSVQNSS